MRWAAIAGWFVIAIQMLGQNVPALGNDQKIGAASDLRKHAKRAYDDAMIVESWFPHLQSRAELLTSITVIVIILSVLPTVLTLGTKNWMKIVMASISAVVAILIGIKAQVFHADKENYESILIEAKLAVRLIKSAHEELESTLAANPNGLSVGEAAPFLKNFPDYRNKLTELSNRAVTLKVALLSPGPLVKRSALPVSPAVAYAASGDPVLSASSTAADLVAVGVGACSTTFGAKEYARYEARRLIASEFDSKATPEKLVALINVNEDDGAFRDRRNQLNRERKDGLFIYRAETLLNRNRASSNNSTIRAERDLHSRWEGVAALSPGSTKRFEVSTRPGQSEGKFTFVFDAVRSHAEVRLELLEILIFDDGSGNSTRWYFDVSVENRRVFRVPTHRYEDGGHPTLCKPSIDEGLKGNVSIVAPRSVNVKVTGYKPKDL